MDVENPGAGGIAVKGDLDRMVAEMTDLRPPGKNTGCVIDRGYALRFCPCGKARGVGAREHERHGSRIQVSNGDNELNDIPHFGRWHVGNHIEDRGVAGRGDPF